MNRQNINAYIIAIVTVMSFISVSVGATYAFFVAKVFGNLTNGDVTLKTADVLTVFEAGGHLNDIDIMPGYSNTMEFKIVNVSEQEGAYGNYSLVWEIRKNEIYDNNFVYTLKGTSYRNGNNLSESVTNKVVNVTNDTRVPSVSTTIGMGTINTGVTHSYVLTLKFKESGINQSVLQAKTFDASIVAKGDSNV